MSTDMLDIIPESNVLFDNGEDLVAFWFIFASFFFIGFAIVEMMHYRRKYRHSLSLSSIDMNDNGSGRRRNEVDRFFPSKRFNDTPSSSFKSSSSSSSSSTLDVQTNGDIIDHQDWYDAHISRIIIYPSKRLLYVSWIIVYTCCVSSIHGFFRHIKTDPGWQMDVGGIVVVSILLLSISWARLFFHMRLPWLALIMNAIIIALVIVMLAILYDINLIWAFGLQMVYLVWWLLLFILNAWWVHVSRQRIVKRK